MPGFCSSNTVFPKKLNDTTDFGVRTILGRVIQFKKKEGRVSRTGLDCLLRMGGGGTSLAAAGAGTYAGAG